MQQLADLVGREGIDSAEFGVQARATIANNPEFERILIRTGDGRVMRSMPPVEPGPGIPLDPAWQITFSLASSIGHLVFGAPYIRDGHGALFEAHVPIFQAGRLSGMVVGVFSFDALLFHQVPWWFAEKYKLEIIDGNGAVLAAKSHLPIDEPEANYQLRFEPPGQGLALVATVPNPRYADLTGIGLAFVVLLVILLIAKYGKGFLANLVLLDADPLVRIGNTKKISAVWLRGKCFDRKYLDGLLIQALQKNQ